MSRAGMASRMGRLTLACGLAGGVALLLLGMGPIRHASSGVSDWLLRLAPAPTPPLDFGLVLIDSSSLKLDQVSQEEIAASEPLRLMAAGFPWSRAVYADAIRKILDAGARLVILDILLPGDREGSAELKRVLAEYPGQVVLMSNFVEDLSGDGHVVLRYQPPFDGNFPEKTSVGFANFWRDPDGVVRSASFQMRRPGGEIAFSSPATALELLVGKEAREGLPATARFIPCMQGLNPDLRIPLWQIFFPGTWKTNLRDGSVFQDRVIAIGASAQEFHDEFQTPAGQVVGAGLHLGVLGSAMVGALYQDHGWMAGILGCLLGAFGVWFCWIGFSGITPKLLALLFASGALVGLSLAALLAIGWMPPTFEILFGGALAGVSGLGSDLIAEGRERLRARRILERYVSPEVTREILDHRNAFLESLGGTRRDVTILFSDIRGFTAQSENGNPSDVFGELNEYFSHMVSEILDSGGWVDKFMGDGILAVWGVIPTHAISEETSSALSCAMGMRRALEELNASRSAKGLGHWRIGIGIHSGEVLFGNLGTEAKMEPTVIGDTVNLASRIEGYTKALGVDFLFSRETLETSQREHSFRPADHVRLVGRSEPTELFTSWPESFSEAERDSYCKGVALFRSGQFEAANACFKTLLSCHPEDSLATVYQNRCQTFLVHPPPDGWEGITAASGK